MTCGASVLTRGPPAESNWAVQVHVCTGRCLGLRFGFGRPMSDAAMRGLQNVETGWVETAGGRSVGISA